MTAVRGRSSLVPLREVGKKCVGFGVVLAFLAMFGADSFLDLYYMLYYSHEFLRLGIGFYILDLMVVFFLLFSFFSFFFHSLFFPSSFFYHGFHFVSFDLAFNRFAPFIFRSLGMLFDVLGSLKFSDLTFRKSGFMNEYTLTFFFFNF